MNPLPLCGFVNWYPIMNREAGALNVYPSQLERKRKRLCGFVNWYPIMNREAGALNVYPSQLERKRKRARQNNYKKPKLFCIN
jgi:hypothetical protein